MHNPTLTNRQTHTKTPTEAENLIHRTNYTHKHTHTGTLMETSIELQASTHQLKLATNLHVLT